MLGIVTTTVGRTLEEILLGAEDAEERVAEQALQRASELMAMLQQIGLQAGSHQAVLYPAAMAEATVERLG